MGLIRMGPPEELILALKNKYDLEDFIETGTYHGHTAAWAAIYFKNVKTVEYSKNIYIDSVSRHSAKKNINFILGDSRIILQEIIPGLASPAIFWLDSHWMAGNTYGENDECPLIDEIQIIKGSQIAHFLLIDDARLFTSPPPRPHQIEQWPTIDKVIEALKAGEHKYYIVITDDVIVAVPEYARETVAIYCQELNTKARQSKNSSPAKVANQQGNNTINQGLKIFTWIKYLSIERWLPPLVDFRLIRKGIRGYRQYWRDWKKYANMANSEPLLLENAYPCLYDRTAVTPFDPHYFYQDIWAFKSIQRISPTEHIDVGSLATFVGFLSTITKVIFIDIRPLIVDVENFDSRQGTILALPFPDNSVSSLSCLNVAEHIGLGRYGDPLDPEGTIKATRELARVLAPGGHLYFSVPVGKPRICFNAHRIHSPQQILDFLSDLQLIEFSGTDDNGKFKPIRDPAELADSKYACGFFHFIKR